MSTDRAVRIARRQKRIPVGEVTYIDPIAEMWECAPDWWRCDQYALDAMGETHEYTGCVDAAGTYQRRARMKVYEALAKLRQPFPDHQISYLPKGGVKLAYVGHAALTDRLLDADPAWTWEPLAMSPDGLPVFDNLGGMWIRLTVCGVTRIGYGHAGTKEGGDAIKEVIGDALRNAAMRFGAALDLWHKGDLHKEAKEDTRPPPLTESAVADWLAAIADAAADEVEGVVKSALAAATAAKDREAFMAFRAAAKKREKVAA